MKILNYSIILVSFILIFSFIIPFANCEDLPEPEIEDTDNVETIMIYLWIILMIVFLFVSLSQPEWGILAGIIWILASLQIIIPINTALGLIIISIGMILMVYGIIELMKR